ncbi:hypothetical protein [Couchioplanes caeruleus]|uniref:Uncharacterized protein n=1 Tax=Couchioplanes caeruleus subsp. caeruleus TaxID=56427 RepID=A0A1K0H1I0_9ACTN|nr:hypothetical protein [Couchioplanes caeruleus]OJF15555.1 hypothetical protein BG844_03490 [Couchioplanes caeruleus subsp. caeruleus]
MLIPTTALNGLVVGYFPMWLSMGAAYDRGDYSLSAGGYGTAALVLLTAVTGIRGFRGPRHPAARTAAALALVLGLFAAVFGLKAAREPASSVQIGHVNEGIFPVLFMPWTMALLIAGLIGTYKLCVGNRHTGSASSAR